MHIGLNAHLLGKGSGYRSAGIHSYIHNLLAHLPAAAPDDWRFTAMVGAGNPARFDGITVRPSSLDTESPKRRILWEQIIQPFALRDFDLYHALAFVAPLAVSMPTVVTIYDLSFVHYPERLPAARRLYLQRLTGITCRRARRVLAISESTAKDVSEQYGIPLSKIDVTPCGYDPALYRPLPDADVQAFKAARNLPDEFWFFVGTLEPRKNLITLFEAYAGLPQSARVPLIIGGGKGWQYEPIFEAVERLRLTDDVRFVGFIPTEDLPLWYNSARVFVYPSVYEGFGLPVLEAMACGTPVMTSTASSLPEVAGDAGLCVPPHDVDAWRAALTTAQDATWRDAARAKGLQQAARFSWANTAAGTITSYRRAIER